MIKITNRKSIAVLVHAILLFLLQKPYFVWGIAGDSVYYLILALVFTVLLVKHLEPSDSKKRFFAFSYIVVLFLYVIIRIFHGATFLGAVFFSFSIVFVLFLFVEKSYCKKLLDTYLTLYCIITILSLFSWIGVLVGFMPSSGTIQHYYEDWTYSLYPLCIQLSGIESIRFCGVFDEPGVIGNAAVILLCMGGFNLKDWRIIIVLISGLFSLSLYFFIVIGVFFVINSVYIKKQYITGLIIIIMSFGLYYSTRDIPVFYDTLWNRFEWDSDSGTIAGNDRMTDEAEVYYQNIKGTSEYFWGVNNQSYYSELSKGGSSYKNIVASVGAVFFFLYLGWFLLVSYRCSRRREFFLFALVVITMFYQRVNLYNPYWLFIFIAFARYFDLLNKRKTII